MPAVNLVLKPDGRLIFLIKPQFEASKHEIGSGGIVHDEKIRKIIVDNVIDGIKKYGFEFIGVIESPITGAKGNKEFLAYFKRIA